MTAMRLWPTGVVSMPRFRATLAATAIGLLTLVLLIAGPAGPAVADTTANTDDSNISTPTGWWSYTNVSEATINDHLDDNGARLTDIEPYNSSATRFTVTMVSNSGAYQVPGWWWYFGKTGGQVENLLDDHNARLIHLQPYVVSGKLRFAAIMVNNTGAQARNWHWYWGKSAAFIDNHLDDHNARLTDLETYFIGGDKRYALISVRNTGDDANGWWWYLNQTAAGVKEKRKDKGARLIDLERLPNGKYNVVMVRNKAPDAAASWWYVNKSSLGSVLGLANQFGARLLDIETYTSGGDRRYAAVLIDNSNAETRRVRKIYGGFFNNSSGNPLGPYEAYLESMNTGPIVTLNQHKKTEVASTLKVLHLIHSMRQIALGNDTLDVADVGVFHYGQGSVNGANNVCPSNSLEDPGDPSTTQTLRTTLQQMIRNSNNAATRAIVLEYRSSTSDPAQYSVFNNTADFAGMEDTTLRNDIGCGYKNGGNLTTADDLATAYENVVEGNILTPTTRTDFWNIFGTGALGSNTTELSNAISSVINSEAGGLTGAELTDFRGRVLFYAKRGGYSVCKPGTGGNNDPPCKRWTIRTYSGRVALPFKGSAGGPVLRNYTFGSIVADFPTSCWSCAAQTAVVNNTVTATAEMFRTQVKNAIATW